METKDKEIIQMRKRNMKLFPIYKALSWDYLFFHTIDFLFLIQVKGIAAGDIVLKTAFRSFFGIMLQLPANIIVEFLGRKNSLILGNVLNCLYMVIFMLSKSLGDLIFAEFFATSAFCIKSIVETNMLSESIPPSKNKSKIFSKINSSGASKYYILSSITKIIAGFMFKVNGYLPIICSLSILILDVILSMFFIEPIEKKKHKVDLGSKEIKEIKQGFKFVLKSERLKALILISAFIKTLVLVLVDYNTSILEDIGISAVYIGILSSTIGITSAIASKKEMKFHNKFRNKSLMTIALILSISCIISGIAGVMVEKYSVLFGVIIIYLILYGSARGMYYTLIDKYLGNFANKKVNTKIYTVSELIASITRVIGGLFAAFLLNRMSTAYSMITLGILFTIIYILTGQYMKTRVGLKPEEYSKEERKYDEFKEIQKV